MKMMFLNAKSFNQDISTKIINEGETDEYTAWDASSLSSEIYLYRLQAGSQIMTRKLTVVK